MSGSQNARGTIDEMAIVDTFTKLIFDAQATLDKTELILVKLLAQIDSSLADASLRDISEHLRSMGVDEMISVVDQVRRYYDQR